MTAMRTTKEPAFGAGLSERWMAWAEQELVRLNQVVIDLTGSEMATAMENERLRAVLEEIRRLEPATEASYVAYRALA